jgi:hypothetical protein
MLRRILPVCALAALFAFPAVGTATARDNGTLSVKNATASVSFAARGARLGHCDRCTLWIEDPNPTDGAPPVVTPLGVQRTQISDTRTSYVGNDLRFKVIGGFFRVKVVGTGIDLSVVATGFAVLDGEGGAAGTFSLDGGTFAPMPGFRVPLKLGN